MKHRTAFGDTPATRCRYYREVCDLAAVVDPPGLGRIIVRATTVWAVTMPAVLGSGVRAEIARGYGVTGPILAHPRSNRWSFLIRPDLPDDVPLFAEMFRYDVSVIRTGGTIALPSPADLDTHLRQWIEPPRCPVRPSGHTVTGAVRAVTGTRGCRGMRIRL
ncbi:DNA-directed RNA polymerase subunit beta [Nocardia sp. NPDC019395]|uniref:DNA-directed RNA polymerase subunit beta n=1 Tax=Nocardia sp. NPDC019395 TaxID=3154686 RepID=UPI0033C5CFCE